MGRCEGECQIGLGCCAGKKSGGRVTSVIEKIIASNAPKITGILVLIAEHEVHHALSSEAGNRPEKAGFAQMDLIAFAIVGRAITPTGAKSAELQPIPFNARAIATNVAQDITASIRPLALAKPEPRPLGRSSSQTSAATAARATAEAVWIRVFFCCGFIEGFPKLRAVIASRSAQALVLGEGIRHCPSA